VKGQADEGEDQMDSRLADAVEEPELVEIAKELILLQTLRSRLVPAAMFSDIAWEVLLLLYSGSPIGDQELSAVAKRAQAPVSTTARWVEYLIHEGFLERSSRCSEPPRIRLTDKARRLFRIYLAEMIHSSQRICQLAR
jgi:DNA-binding MarR family transcriptional regulator